MHSPRPRSRSIRRHVLRGVLILGAVIFIASSPRTARANWPHSPSGNVPVCTAAGDQYDKTFCAPDGNGGAFVCWMDRRYGDRLMKVYVQHLAAAGVVDAFWPLDGLAVCTADSAQYVEGMIADGSGGVIIAWFDQRGGTDWDIYAQRVNAAGVPQWTANGVPVCWKWDQSHWSVTGICRCRQRLSHPFHRWP